MAETLPPDLLEPIEKVARFIETGDRTLLSAFAPTGVVIIENFAPHLFEGPTAVERWSQTILRWHQPPTTLVLKHSFGAPQELRVQGDEAFVSLPTYWSISEDGETIEEDGGWAFVLARHADGWKVRAYGWAVTNIEEG